MFLHDTYKFLLSETFISFSITILLNFTEIWESEYWSYCFLKKSLIEDCFILWNLLWFILFEIFRSKGSRFKSLVKSVNLFRISIASSTSFRDGGDKCSSITSFSSLLPSSTVSAGCGRYLLTISSTDNGRDSLVTTFLSKSTSPPASRFSGAKSADYKLHIKTQGEYHLFLLPASQPSVRCCKIVVIEGLSKFMSFLQKNKIIDWNVFTTHWCKPLQQGFI